MGEGGGTRGYVGDGGWLNFFQKNSLNFREKKQNSESQMEKSWRTGWKR
jgi:hypothetical protein